MMSYHVGCLMFDDQGWSTWRNYDGLVSTQFKDALIVLHFVLFFFFLCVMFLNRSGLVVSTCQMIGWTVAILHTPSLGELLALGGYRGSRGCDPSGVQGQSP